MERGLITFSSFMNNKLFVIPIYQRNYSWEKEQLEDLWDDLYYLENGKKHYFGTILTKDTKEPKYFKFETCNTFEIIDGQQRLTSICILISMILYEIKISIGEDKELLDKLKDIEHKYLKKNGEYILTLLDDDRDIYEKYIIENKEYPNLTLTPSNRRLKFAKTFFSKKISIEKSDLLDDELFIQFLSNLLIKINNLEINNYSVADEADATLIFETVNNRGKSLSRLEKTKSLLMHLVYLSADKANANKILIGIEKNFSNIYKNFENIQDSNNKIDEEAIQRYHFIYGYYEGNGDKNKASRYLEVLKNDFKELYKLNKEKCLKQIIDYSNNLEESFFAMKEIITYDKNDNIKTLLSKIFLLERTANFFPVLLAWWIKFKEDTEKIENLLSLIEIFAFRVYAIGKRRSDTGESSLYRLSNDFYNDSMDAEYIYGKYIDELKNTIKIYSNDQTFIEDLELKNFYRKVSSKDIKYLLCEYEIFIRQEVKEKLSLDFDTIFQDKYTIEHIWSQTPREIKDELKKIHEDNVHKIGNLTLASREWNSSFGNKDFTGKKESYAKSSFHIQRNLQEFDNWGEKTIEQRTSQIIKFALRRWQFYEKPSSVLVI